MISRLLLTLALACAALLAAPSAANAQSAGARAAYDANAKALVSQKWQATSDKFERDLEVATVRLQFLIRPDGTPANVRATVQNNVAAPNFARIAKEMIEKMRFPPVPPSILKGTNGKGIPSEMVLTMAG